MKTSTKALLLLFTLVCTAALAQPMPLSRNISLPGTFPALWRGFWDDASERIAKLKRSVAKSLNLTSAPLNEDEERCLRFREMDRAIRLTKASEEAKGFGGSNQLVNLAETLKYMRDMGQDEFCKRPGPGGVPNRGDLMSPSVEAPRQRDLLEDVKSDVLRAMESQAITWERAAAIVGAALLAAPVLAPL